MSNKTWCIIIIIILLSLAVFCCINAGEWNSNLVSMISGLWSAVATVILGAIAVWQNKRYKQLSDEMQDAMNAPEFYIPTPANDIEKFSKLSFNVITGKGNAPCGLSTGTGHENAFTFSSIDKPIINLKPVFIMIDQKKEVISVQNNTGIDVFCSRDLFSIKISNCKAVTDGEHEMKVCINYENIYGTKYQKIYTTRISVQENRIVSHKWGVLSRAEKIN